MSEYQYFAFRAVDVPLTREQMDEVRALSTRARITPTDFVNEYHFGDFHGKPMDMVRRYYDLHVHFANWGTRRWVFRVPVSAIDVERVESYAAGDIVDMRPSGERYLITIGLSPDDGGEYMDEDQDVEAWMADLAQLRQDVMEGDLRLLYLGWLLAVQWEDVEEDAEPPVPAGLKRLSGPLKTFCKVFGLDDDLLAAAAESSEDMAEHSDAGLGEWVARLPQGQKDQMLVELCEGKRPGLAGELRSLFRKSQAKPGAASRPGRTVAQLRARAEELETAREAEEAAVRAAKARREQREREVRLRQMIGSWVQHWDEVERLIQTKTPGGYTQATKTLKDLRDAASLAGSNDDFARRLQQLRGRHRAKSSLIAKLRSL